MVLGIETRIEELVLPLFNGGCLPANTAAGPTSGDCTTDHDVKEQVITKHASNMNQNELEYQHAANNSPKERNCHRIIFQHGKKRSKLSPKQAYRVVLFAQSRNRPRRFAALCSLDLDLGYVQAICQ